MYLNWENSMNSALKTNEKNRLEKTGKIVELLNLNAIIRSMVCNVWFIYSVVLFGGRTLSHIYYFDPD